MANTEYQESLDFLDILSVCLYRLGISVFAFGLIAMTISGCTLLKVRHFMIEMCCCSSPLQAY